MCRHVGASLRSGRRHADTPQRRNVFPDTCLLPGRSILRLFHTVSREFGFSNWLKSILISIYLLELVGASAITTLGCVACTLLQIDWGPSAPLWFAGYLFVYNADRLQLDPADRLNTPLRFSWERRLRGCRIVLAWISAIALGMWPVLTRRFWLLLPLAVAAGLLCFYSRPIPGAGFRLKDLPYLKSLLAPTAIAIVLVPWPALESGNVPRQREWLVFSWIFLILTINALIFDYRDIVGDRLNGTKTIPAVLGHRRTRGLLMFLSAALVFVSIALSWLRLAGPFMPGTLTFGCAVLLWSLRRRARPALLSLLADSLLFLPAIGEWLR
jgi:4-hydroxybenzoate polyprenyltransferase